MTRRKKTKSTASGHGAAAMSAPAQSASAGVPQHDGARLGASASDVIHVSSSNTSASKENKSKTKPDSSTHTSDSKDIKSNKKSRQPYKVKVTYETKQIHIYPRQPLLMVERLKNLEHHVGVLTEAVGRRPSVYPHGRCVRFVSETQAEYTTIQRYLARIEEQERIAWCSYSLPPGNSLKVNVKVRVVERIKITDDLTKLKLKDEKSGKPFETEKKDGVENDLQSAVISNAKSTPREKRLSTSTSVPNNKNSVNPISTSSSGQLAVKAKDKQQAAVKANLKVAVAGSVQQGTKKDVNTGTNLKKTNKIVKTSSALITEQNVRDTKLRIVVRSNKMF